MADASNPFDARRRRPRDWGEAFADLPLETPPLSVWSQIEARMNASSAEAVVVRMPNAEPSARPQSARRKLSNRGWLALAASVSALALLPLLWSNMRDASTATDAVLAGQVSRPDRSVAPVARSVAPAHDASAARTATTPAATASVSAPAYVSSQDH